MTFLQMLRRRFEGKDPNIPWELDNKVLAYEHVSKHDFKTPISASFESSKQATEWALKNFENKFVIKAGNFHSCMGVYLIEEYKENEYIELLKLKKISLDKIGEDIGRNPSYWIAESFISSYIFGKSIPLDYKFYTFRGKIALILQIDRNISPPKVAFFDGNFIPLIHNKDYTIDTNRWLSCGHVLPYHLADMVNMVSTLSKSLDTDFVSIDCFDSPDGPIFGEFTFAPGAPDAKMVTFSDEIINQLDNMINFKSSTSLSGMLVDHDEFLKMCVFSSKTSLTNDLEIYGRVAARMINYDRKIGATISDKDLTLESNRLKQHIDFILKYISFINGDAEQSFTLANRIYHGSAFFKPKTKHLKLITSAYDFYNERKNKGPWFETRLEQVKLTYYPEQAINSLNKINEIASTGYKYAQSVYKGLTNS